MSIRGIVNFADANMRRMFLDTVREYDGEYRVEIVKHRRRRSNPQNALYWVAVVQPFADFLREQGEAYTDEDAHEILKAKFLRFTVKDKTGAPIGESVRSTASLNTAEFSEYLEKCVAWLAEMFGIECSV